MGRYHFKNIAWQEDYFLILPAYFDNENVVLNWQQGSAAVYSIH